MTFEARDLNLTDPTKGFLHFVVYTEPSLSIASNSLNADISIEPSQTHTPHFQEWRSRLERCEPNALHCALVEPHKIPALFHPCVDEDKTSPSAVRESGCLCRRAFYDPAFGLPVVGEHFKHAGTGGTDQWTYQTYAPLDLRPDDTFSRLIVSRGLFWARTEKGPLSILPQKHAIGYNIGYSGGGPHALAAYLTQVADSDGQNTAAGTEYEVAHPAILAWTQNQAADHGANENEDTRSFTRPRPHHPAIHALGHRSQARRHLHTEPEPAARRPRAPARRRRRQHHRQLRPRLSRLPRRTGATRPAAGGTRTHYP